jgi:hypothetical protein
VRPGRGGRDFRPLRADPSGGVRDAEGVCAPWREKEGRLCVQFGISDSPGALVRQGREKAP